MQIIRGHWSEFLDILEELKPLMDEKDGYPLDMTFPVGETSILLLTLRLSGQAAETW